MGLASGLTTPSPCSRLSQTCSPQGIRHSALGRVVPAPAAAAFASAVASARPRRIPTTRARMTALRLFTALGGRVIQQHGQRDAFTTRIDIQHPYLHDVARL